MRCDQDHSTLPRTAIHLQKGSKRNVLCENNTEENMNIVCEKTVIRIDYAQPLEDMIEAGRYYRVNGLITPKRFPITGTGVVEFEPGIFHPANPVSWWDDLNVADPLHVWRIGIEYLLAYGAATAERRHAHPIIALGAITEVDRHLLVAYLGDEDGKRILDLRWFYHGWDPSCRFLTACKRHVIM